MTRLGSAASLDGGQEVALPDGVEELLVNVVADGFTLYCCGAKDAPRALVARYEWEHHVDLLTVQDFARVITDCPLTARVPTRGLPVDIFAPEIVVWAYEARRSTRCGPCWGWCTPGTPMRPPPAIRRLRACVFPVRSNAR